MEGDSHETGLWILPFKCERTWRYLPLCFSSTNFKLIKNSWKATFSIVVKMSTFYPRVPGFNSYWETAVMAQVMECLSHTWKTRMVFAALSFDITQPDRAVWGICGDSPYLSVSL